MQKNRAILWGMIVAALTVAVAVLMFPVPSTWKSSTLQFYLPLVSNVIMACLHVGAAVLFIMNLDVYKATLRRAYITIAVGIVFSAVGMLQVSIIGALNAWDSPWVMSGGMILPLLATSPILYFGVRYLAQLIGMKHLLMRTWIVLPLSLVICIVFSFVPHVATTVPEMAYDVVLGITVFATCLTLITSLLVFAVRHYAGAHYTRAMTWLGWALFVGSLIFATQTIYSLTSTDVTSLLVRLMNLLALMSGLLWVRASYAFALTKGYDEEVPLIGLLFGQLKPKTAERPKTVVDMIVNVASLVSNSSDIDPLLDNLRTITAKLRPGEIPSPRDTQLLIDTYLKIEHYLTTQEAIRRFSQKELRARLDPNLQKMIIAHD